jgi:hypothetical protein
MTTFAYNDMPGELKDKIRTQEILNRIIQSNGFADTDAITNDMANLKNQLNSLLDLVVGVELEIDGVHQYDDSSIKTDIANIKTQITNTNNNITTLTGKITGYSYMPAQTIIDNSNRIELDSFVDPYGTRTIMTPNQLTLQANVEQPQGGGASVMAGQIVLGGASETTGISITSEREIHITNTGLEHYIHINPNQVNISDINGIKIANTEQGIVFSALDDSKGILLPWAN